MALRIAIIGAGLGGLAAGLFLRKAGVEAAIYEQGPELREVGAGIVVSPNMVRPLKQLGLSGELEKAAVRLDAAWEFRHAVLPFFAQGAAQAIEDAVVLARCLQSADRDSVPQALQRYESIRRPRTSQVQVMSRGREVRNYLPDGPEQQRRDAELGDGDPLRDSAWLYGYDAKADL